MRWQPPPKGLRGLPARVVRANFRQAPQVLAELGIGQINGALLDLGVSSHQLDDAAGAFPTTPTRRWTCA